MLTRSAYYGTSVLIHDHFDPDAVNRAIDREGVTLVSLVPPLLERLLEARGGHPFPESLRAALVGGGPAPEPLLRRAADRGLRALPTYGMTETTSQVATLSPPDWPAGLDTVGRPLPFVRVELRDSGGRVLGPGKEGAIFVRGPMVAEAYFDDPERNATAFDRRWLRTGDFGAWDEAGRLRLLDRGDRMVVGGENVSPLEVEQVLARHPAVAEVCVVALPAGAWGHQVVAVVACRPGLASFKLPRRLHVLDALPRNGAGKLLRAEIRSRLAEEMAGKDRA